MEMGASDIDIRHRYSLALNYELPFAKDSTGMTRQLFAGWQVNAVAFWQSGLPFTVVNATPRSNTGVGANGDRPDRVCSGVLDDPSVDKWFDTSCFVGQAVNTVGNSGRNILYGPAQRRIDMSFFKDFATRGDDRLQLRVEIFNLTNFANFRPPNAALGSATFGRLTTTLGPPRQFQFALKYLF
jgi:hypothetical protein